MNVESGVVRAVCVWYGVSRGRSFVWLFVDFGDFGNAQKHQTFKIT